MNDFAINFIIFVFLCGCICILMLIYVAVVEALMTLLNEEEINMQEFMFCAIALLGFIFPFFAFFYHMLLLML